MATPTVSDFSFGVLGALLDSVVCFKYVSALSICMVSAHGMLRDLWTHFHFISPAFISSEISHCLISDSLKEKEENGAGRNDV
jgi:hypothetical protein